MQEPCSPRPRQLTEGPEDKRKNETLLAQRFIPSPTARHGSKAHLRIPYFFTYRVI
jgi:hypothetical protein